MTRAAATDPPAPGSGLDRLVAGVVHDLNNVLAVVLAAAQDGLSDGASAEAAREALATIAAAAATGRSMVRSLLAPDPAACAAGGPAARAGCEVDALLRDLQPSLARLCGPRVALLVAPAAGGARVAADALVLERVLLNLVANARDAAGTGGTVRVRSARRRSEALGGAEAAVIEVADDGPPVAPEVLARMGEAFFTTKPAGQGTGLGLATVRSLLAEIGGVLALASAPEGGIRAAVHLPVLVARAPPGGTGLVLLVEDDPALRLLAGRALARRGWSVAAAASAAAARALLAEPASGSDGAAGLAALVTDLSLPDLDGGALAAEVRGIVGRPDLPVVLVSGLAAPPQDAPPGVAFLAKPYDLGELADLLAELTVTRSSFVPAKPGFMNK